MHIGYHEVVDRKGALEKSTGFFSSSSSSSDPFLVVRVALNNPIRPEVRLQFNHQLS